MKYTNCKIRVLGLLAATLFGVGQLCAQSAYVSGAPSFNGASPAAATENTDDQSLITIRSRVNEVNVLFIATDKHGKFVRDLNQADFSILDDHKPPQAILNFRRETDLPLHLGLLVDSSGSMSAPAGDRTRWQVAAQALLDAIPFLPPSDLLSVGSFARDLRWWKSGVSVRDAALTRLPAEIQPSGPTNLDAALSIVVSGNYVYASHRYDGLRTYLLVPNLKISPSTSAGVALAWPASLTPRFVLQKNSDVASTNWLTATNTSAVIANGDQITIPPMTNNTFYRLKFQ